MGVRSWVISSPVIGSESTERRRFPVHALLKFAETVVFFSERIHVGDTNVANIANFPPSRFKKMFISELVTYTIFLFNFHVYF